MSLEEKESLTQAAAFETKFDEAMDDDFNTADAISAIFEMVKYVNTNISGENSKSFIQTVLDKMVNLCDVLGIIVDKKEEILAEDIEKMIEDRQAARKAKDFKKADEIRDALLAKGIVLEDTREGVKWKKA